MPLLLGAKFLTVEEATRKYGMGEARKNPVEMG